MKKEPYIIKERVVVERFYNPDYGDNEICRCGHAYYRHFDSWEDMEAVGCKYCPCHTFKQANCQITEEWVKPVVGSMSLIGVCGEPPHAHANYFSLECGSRVLNFWAENLEAAVKKFNIDEIRIRRYTGEGFDVCLIDHPHIPKEWYLDHLCFTGSRVPPLEVLEDIFWFGQFDCFVPFRNDIEMFSNPVEYYAKKGAKYDPKTGIISFAVPASNNPKVDVSEWKIDVSDKIEAWLDPALEVELERQIIEDITVSVTVKEEPTGITISFEEPTATQIQLPPEKTPTIDFAKAFQNVKIPEFTPEQWELIRKHIEIFKKEITK